MVTDLFAVSDPLSGATLGSGFLFSGPPTILDENELTRLSQRSHGQLYLESLQAHGEEIPTEVVAPGTRGCALPNHRLPAVGVRERCWGRQV
jgi:hypothetical protein